MLSSANITLCSHTQFQRPLSIPEFLICIMNPNSAQILIYNFNLSVTKHIQISPSTIETKVETFKLQTITKFKKKVRVQ